MSSAKLTNSEVEAILREGAYYLIDDHAQRAELQNKIVRTFLDGIESLAGSACRERLAAEGLRYLHRHFPASKVPSLEAYLMKNLRDDLYYWSYRVGVDTLGLPEPFYVDHLIVFRIHYPYLVARAAKDVEAPPFDWGERLRLAGAALRDWQMLYHYFKKHQRAKKRRANKTFQFNPFAYHGQIPVVARSHGPHIDTWYGHSYDGINLWLSIDGVNEDNTVILYPDMFARPMEFDPVSMYLAAGVALSKPHKIAPKGGQLLIFNPETLHGTQVNISDETRVALTTRINPRQPRFTPNAPFHMEHWYSSEDLRNRRFYAVKMFSAAKHQGKPSVIERTPYEDKKTARIRKVERLEQGTRLAVCNSAALRPGEKMAVDFGNAKLLLWRDGDAIRAFTRTCPHLGIDVGDGSHDDNRVFCPGHGIAFSLSDGTSKCPSFKLKQFRAYETEEKIYLERGTDVTADTQAAQSEASQATT